MIKVALTGASGLVGSRIVDLLDKDFVFIPLSQKEMDITDKDSVWKNIKQTEFDIFLHLAGYTNVDGAEKESEIAMKINRNGVKNVYDAVVQKGKKFIYISTDFVFDGKNPPYFEDSLPHPLSVYAQTKYEGEKIVKDNAMIVRIAYPYRKEFEIKKDFVRSIISLLQQKKQLTMVTDSQFTPTFIDDIAFSLKYLFVNYLPEIFHVVGSQTLSPYEGGKMIARTFKLDEELISPATYLEYFKNKAPRPQYNEVKSNKNNFYKMHSFEEGLQFMLQQ